MSTPPPFPPFRHSGIFISCSNRDDALAQRLAVLLDQADVFCWLDSRRLHAGDRLDVVRRGLENCDWLVLIETAAAIDSPWVNMELDAALSRVSFGEMRGVVRLVVEPHAADGAPPIWATLPRYDATTDLDGAVAAMLTDMRAVDALLTRQPSSQMQTGETLRFARPSRAFISARQLRAQIAAVFIAEAWVDVVQLTYRLLATYPTEVTANDLHMRGQALLKLERWVDAVAALSAAYDRARNSLLIIGDYAQALRAVGRLDDAAALYEHALALSGSDSDSRLATLREYVATLQAQGRWDAALARIDDALRLRPDDLDWLTLRIATLTELREANWAMVSLFQEARATLARVNAPPDLTHWLSVVCAMRAAYPNAAAMAGSGDGGDSGDGMIDPWAPIHRAAQEVQDILKRIEDSPNPADRIPSDIVEYGKRVSRVVRDNQGQWNTVYLTVDLSQLTGDDALANVQRAAHEFVQTCGLETTAIGFIRFSEQSAHVKLIQQATHDARAIAAAIARLGMRDGETPTAGRLFTTLYDVMSEWQGPRYGVVVADGSWGPTDDAIQGAQRCHAAGIGIAAIALGYAEHGALDQIASAPDLSMRCANEQLAHTLTTLAQRLSGA